jgi:hypothetical protein
VVGLACAGAVGTAFAGAGARVLAGVLVLARAGAVFFDIEIYGAGFSSAAGVACPEAACSSSA